MSEKNVHVLFSFLNYSSVKGEILCWPFLPSAFSRYHSTTSCIYCLEACLLPLWLTFLPKSESPLWFAFKVFLFTFDELWLYPCVSMCESNFIFQNSIIVYFMIRFYCKWFKKKNSLNHSGLYNIDVSFLLNEAIQVAFNDIRGSGTVLSYRSTTPSKESLHPNDNICSPATRKGKVQRRATPSFDGHFWTLHMLL